VCNKPEVYHRTLHVRISLMRRYSTPTNGATWACGIVEGNNGAVGRRPVVTMRTLFSNSRQLWVRHRLFPQRRPFPQPQHCQPQRLRHPLPQRETPHQKALVQAQKPASGPV
jgi:hypothetical protein